MKHGGGGILQYVGLSQKDFKNILVPSLLESGSNRMGISLLQATKRKPEKLVEAVIKIHQFSAFGKCLLQHLLTYSQK